MMTITRRLFILKASHFTRLLILTWFYQFYRKFFRDGHTFVAVAKFPPAAWGLCHSMKTRSAGRKTRILFLLFFLVQSLCAQQYTIVIKGGHVIDPKNNIDDVLDIAISNGKITGIAKSIDTRSAFQVIDAAGMYVVPGLIDIHTHDFYGPDSERAFCNGTMSIAPDAFTFRSGVTTVVDAGSTGWRDFPAFKKQVIDISQTRVLAFLNIVGDGMRGGAYEQDIKDMDGKSAAMTAQKYRDYIVGIKLAHYKGHDWGPVDEAIEAGNLANIPVMIDFGDNPSPLSIKELFLRHMRPGDIFTHCFADLRGREPIVEAGTKNVKPFIWQAMKKGIAFDVGYGEISFAFSQAVPAVKTGFYPSSLSTDMHSMNKKDGMKDILNIMSKFLAIGMGFKDVIKTVTWNPAREIKHEELGNLSVGAPADVAILSVQNGNFDFYDCAGRRIEGTNKFECEITIKGGKVVNDLKG